MRLLKLAALLLSLFLVCSTPASAGIIFFDDFSTYQTGMSLSDLGEVWTVVPGTTTVPWAPYNGSVYTGTVDLLGVGNYPGGLCALAGGPDPCVDLVGTAYTMIDGEVYPSPSGARLQTNMEFDFLPGLTYHLIFSISGSQRNNTNIVTAGITNGIVLGTYEMDSGYQFTQMDLSFTVPVATRGRIYFDNSSNLDTANCFLGPCMLAGAMLSNVTLVEMPEPLTTGLVGLGLIATALIPRRILRK